MSDDRSRTALGALIAAHPWSRVEFVAHYNRVADELGEATSLSLRQLDRWIRGDLATGLPQSAARRVLRHIFALPAERLFSTMVNSSGQSGHDEDKMSRREEREWVTAAEQQARAARTYADLIDYTPLMAWCFGLEAEAAYWTGAPRRALDLVSAGLAVAPAGTARVRLHCIGARAWSYMGPTTADRVNTALSAADTERETGLGDELHDELGGHFSFSRARQARCNATTYVQLGSSAEASEQARTALELYAPTGGQWRLIEAEVRADLAAAHLLSGDLDGADAALAPVWGLATHDRREGLLHRLRQTGVPLADPRWRDVARVEQLAEQIETFAAASIVRALPAGQD